ncbi:MAG: hypothetical protein D6722_05810, partial [Bacteroidetes bacterium]
NINDPFLQSLMGKLTELVSERAELDFSVTADNPNIDRINLEISRVKSSLLENINNRVSSTEFELESVEDQIRTANGRLSRLPRNERMLTQMGRTYESINELYSYLQKKKTEAEIALANLTVDLMIIDPARYTGKESRNSRMLIMALALILAIGLPAGFLVVLSYFSDKVSTYQELKKATPIPVLGTVIKNDDGLEVIKQSTSYSPLAECFRAVRVHIYNKLTNKREKIDVSERGILLGVCSTWSDEGKSFCAANLAASFGIGGYNTLLVDLDLRNPSQPEYFRYPRQMGISNGLLGPERSHWKKWIIKDVESQIDILPAGPHLPNSIDLLDTGAFEELIEELPLHYQYVIVDLPPIMQASDYMLVEKWLDFTAFVVRHQQTRLQDLERINELFEQERIGKIGLLINHVANPAQFRHGDASYYTYGKKYAKVYGAMHT